jgi:polyphenol oxidase
VIPAEIAASPLLADAEVAPGFDGLGLIAFTTARAAGTFGLNERSGDVAGIIARWESVRALGATVGTHRLVSAHQVHGSTIITHRGNESAGWLRVPNADGHLVRRGGIVMTVSIADCVPVFIGHAGGGGALLHAGWRGTAERILPRAIDRFAELGCDPTALQVHLGPSISGRVYEVGPEVHRAVNGELRSEKACIDLRVALARQAAAAGVTRVTVSEACTVTDHPRWFSHRRGDEGRQLAVLIVPSS